MKAPRREVVRVIEMDGECGCFATRRAKTPPRSMPCVACFVKQALA